MNYFNESTADMTGDELHRKLFPIDKLKSYSDVGIKVKEDFKITHRNYPKQEVALWTFILHP